jgi:hypothetical protein
VIDGQEEIAFCGKRCRESCKNIVALPAKFEGRVFGSPLTLGWLNSSLEFDSK